MESFCYNIIFCNTDKEMGMTLSEHCRQECPFYSCYLLSGTGLWHPPDRIVVMIFSTNNLHDNSHIYTYNFHFLEKIQVNSI